MKKFYFMLLCLIVFFVSCDLPVKPINPMGGNGALGESTEMETLLTEADIISTFGLEKNNITASNATMLIKKGVHADLNLTAVRAFAYNDEAGTFSLELTGSKNGKDFGTRTLSFSGFNHPYASMPTSWGVDAKKLKLDKAIEHNYSIAKFIEHTKNDNALKGAVLENLSFKLENHKDISYGEHENKGYSLSAGFLEDTKNPDTKIKIIPSFKVLYKKLVNGIKTESWEELEFSSAIKTTSCDYFTEEDVYNYLIKKISAKSLNFDKDKFASYYSAFKKEIGKLSNEIYASPSEIDAYLAVYKNEKSSESHLYLPNITLNYYGNINANDYDGSLSFDVAVASQEYFSNHKGKCSKPKNIALTGFCKIRTAEDFKKHFSFTIINQSWARRSEALQAYIKAGIINGKALIFQSEGLSLFEKSVWKKIEEEDKKEKSRKFYLNVPEYNSTLKTLITDANKEVAIQSIYLSKKPKKEIFTLTVQLEGGKIIEVEYNADNLK